MNNCVPSRDTIVCAAIEIADADERAAFVARASGADVDLRRRVEALVAAHFQAGSFLEAPAEAPATMAPLTTPPDEVGAMIGPYKLFEQIGEGGMGVVYVAEQTEPVRRRVALKVIKPGMDSREVVARFEAERQALALMDHPNIAHVFDAGTTAAGRPYFVMELVRGLPITEYCDQARLSAEQRLRLFALVCRAVQHAHQKGVIHRDLKPSNVLVTLHDGTPMPKVIDFGVAKAINQRLTDKSVYTRFTQLVGTPLYMSPEQAELSALDVDTRSDVYSLGVLIYELLTGTTPFDAQTFNKASFDEIRRIIREEEPPRPSARVSTLDVAARSTASAKRGLDQRQLSRLLRGDLDWIVMKSLEKDRNRRYESAGAFAADFERYLANEPVEARPPSVGYRMRKFARRNRAVLAAAAVLLAAGLAVAGTLGWTIRDTTARRAGAELAAAVDLTDADGFEQQRHWPDAAAAADRAVAVLESNDVGGEPAAAARKRRTDLAMVRRLENVRLETATVKGGGFDIALGDQLYAAAFREYGIDPETLAPPEVARLLPGGAIRDELVGALEDWARVRREQGGADGGDRLLAAADAADHDPWRQQVRHAWAAVDSKSLKALADSAPFDRLHPCAIMLLQDRMFDADALPVLREAQKRWPGEFWITHTLANRLRKAHPPQLAESVAYYRAALALRPTSPGVWLNLGSTLSDLKRYDDAIESYERAIHVKADYVDAHANLGGVLFRIGKLDRAEQVLRRAVALNPHHFIAHHNLGLVLFERRAYAAAAAEYAEAARLNPKSDASHLYHGIALNRLGRNTEALASYRVALKLNRSNPEVHNSLGGYYSDVEKDYDKAITAFHLAIKLRPDYALAYANLGNVYSDKDDYDEAIKALRESIRIDPNYAPAHAGLGVVYSAKGKLPESIAAFKEAAKLDPSDPMTPISMGNALRLRGQLDEAIAAYRDAIRLKPDFGDAYTSLGGALAMKGLHQEAIKSYRQAIQLNSKSADAHYNLGNSLAASARIDDAIRAFQEALRLEPNIAEAHCNLGTALQLQGKFREALTSFRRGHELGSKRPGWQYPSAQWVKKCEELVALEERSPWFRLLVAAAAQFDRANSVKSDALERPAAPNVAKATPPVAKDVTAGPHIGKASPIQNPTPPAKSRDAPVVTLINALSIGNDAGECRVNDIATDPEGNSYLTGHFYGTIDLDPARTHPGDVDVLTSVGEKDIFVVKYAPDGALIWATRMGGTAQNPGADEGRSIKVDASGHVYVCGQFRTTAQFGAITLTAAGNGKDGFVVKLNPAGSVLWANRWGQPDSAPFTGEIAQGVDTDSAGNVYVISGGPRGFDILKYRANGMLLWEKLIATRGPGCDLAVDAGGNVYVAGTFEGTVDFDPNEGTKSVYSGPGSSGFVLKLTTAGEFVWVSPFTSQAQSINEIRTNGRSSVQRIALDASGNIFVAGIFRNKVDFNPGSDTTNLPATGGAFITKLTTDGGLVWVKAIESDKAVFVWGLATDPLGNVYASGGLSTNADFDPGPGVASRTSAGQNDIFVVKLTSGGNFAWVETFGGPGDDSGFGVAVDPKGTVHLTGYFRGTVDFDPDPQRTLELSNPHKHAQSFLVRLRQK